MPSAGLNNLSCTGARPGFALEARRRRARRCRLWRRWTTVWASLRALRTGPARSGSTERCQKDHSLPKRALFKLSSSKDRSISGVRVDAPGSSRSATALTRGLGCNPCGSSLTRRAYSTCAAARQPTTGHFVMAHITCCSRRPSRALLTGMPQLGLV